MTNAHISDLVICELITQGFAPTGEAGTFAKRVPVTAAYEGALGTTLTVTITIDETGRWLSHVDGWGTVLNDLDLRRYNRGNGARAAIMDVQRNRDDKAVYMMKGRQLYPSEPPQWVFMDRFGDDVERVDGVTGEAIKLHCETKNIKIISAAQFSRIYHGGDFIL